MTSKNKKSFFTMKYNSSAFPFKSPIKQEETKYSVSGEGLDLTDKSKQSKVKVGTSKRDYSGLTKGIGGGLQHLGDVITSATSR